MSARMRTERPPRVTSTGGVTNPDGSRLDMTDSTLAALEARFASHHTVTTECWLWTGGKTKGGYGLFTRRHNKKVLAHRFAWQQANGTIPAGMVVMHSCDMPSCVNPGHLSLGTQQDNIDDKVAKGNQVRGAAFPQAKLSDDAVRDIRAMHKQGRTFAEMARKHNVHYTTAQRAATGQRWGHVV